MQRFFDIIFSLLALIVLSPLLIPCIIILKLTGEGEVFYTQERIGKERKTFGLIKFATMVKNSENMGAGTVTVKNDPRVLPFGKFLRKTKINELPQLINIFKGDMSVIGPRPLAKQQYFYYSNDDQIRISSIPPGLSGIGSIVFRDEEKILSESEDPDIIGKLYREKITPIKAKLESWYVQNRTIYNYFKLIFLTVLVVFFPNVNMKKFFSGDLID